MRDFCIMHLSAFGVISVMHVLTVNCMLKEQNNNSTVKTYEWKKFGIMQKCKMQKCYNGGKWNAIWTCWKGIGWYFTVYIKKKGTKNVFFVFVSVFEI